MIDISLRSGEKGKAHVYLDGPDARLFKLLKNRLLSDELVQNACILQGYLCKLKAVGDKVKMQRVQKMFPRLVGISYSEFLQIIDTSVV
jgi:hypothetical protein